jgi:hypothetical protein
LLEDSLNRSWRVAVYFHTALVDIGPRGVSRSANGALAFLPFTRCAAVISDPCVSFRNCAMQGCTALIESAQ